MLTIPPLEKIISRSRSSKMRNTNAITNSSSLQTNIETRADKNGDGLVYHRSDCGYPRHRVYGAGGDWAGSLCGNWIPDGLTRSLCGVNYKSADIIWYGDKYASRDDSRWSTSIRNTYNNIKNQNGGGQHNWTSDEIDNVETGMIFLQSC